jgi:hypothetical protein
MHHTPSRTANWRPYLELEVVYGISGTIHVCVHLGPELFCSISGTIVYMGEFISKNIRVSFPIMSKYVCVRYEVS